MPPEISAFTERFVQQAYLLHQQEAAIQKLQRDLQRAHAEVEVCRQKQPPSTVVCEKDFAPTIPAASLFWGRIRRSTDGGAMGMGGAVGDGKKFDPLFQRRKSISGQKVLLGSICCVTFLLVLALALFIIVKGPMSKPFFQFQTSRPEPSVEQFNVVGATSVNGLCWARARVNGEEQWCALHHQRNDAETNEWPRNDSDEDKFNAFFSARKRNVGGRQTVDKSANKRSTIGKEIIGLPLFCTFAPSLERIESEATRKGHSLLRGQVKPPLGFRRRTIVILSSYFGGMNRKKRRMYDNGSTSTDLEDDGLVYTYKVGDGEAQKAQNLFCR